MLNYTVTTLTTCKVLIVLTSHGGNTGTEEDFIFCYRRQRWLQ